MPGFTLTMMQMQAVPDHAASNKRPGLLLRLTRCAPPQAKDMRKLACAMMLLPLVAFCLDAPGIAGNMGLDEARQFVIGYRFSFTCLEGTSGEGRVNADGSVDGLIRLGAGGPPHHASLPPGTLRARGDALCASISGLRFEPCFDLDRTGAKTFRGSAPAIGAFASCYFTKQLGSR